jgi:hypothetical protein
MIVENDVRLARRILVALQLDCKEEAFLIRDYLKYIRGVEVVLPRDQTEEQRERFFGRLLDNEKWLARKYGCILLPQYHDCVFLNSKWANPYTLYVRLVEPVEELGELGKIYWLPLDQIDKWEGFADKNHTAYMRATAIPEKPGLLDRFKLWWIETFK